MATGSARSAWKGLCFLCLCIGFAAIHAQGNVPADWYAEGQRLSQQKQYQAAAEAFGRAAAADALSRVPVHPDAPLQEAHARFEARDYPAAERAVRTYLRAHPGSADALYLLAFTQERQNQPRASLESYNRAAQLQTPSAEALRQVSLDYVLLDDYSDALAWLQRAVSSDPTNAEAFYDMARVEMHQGKFDQAIEALHRSLRLKPGDARALGNLGKCLENQNRFDEAERTYAQAVVAADADKHAVEEPYLDYGALLNTRNRFSAALPLLTRAAEIAPSDPHAWEEVGRAHLGLHDTAKAESALERAVSLDPGNSRLHYQLARVYRANGKEAQARQEFNHSSELYGGKSAE